MVGAVLAAFGLSGCASDVENYETHSSYSDGYLNTKHGKVYCVFVGHGVSCDWSNTK
ncbi:hypothetical protein J4T96_gp090 [Mycobacterium phage Finemlucis]|uniref:Lipoprotein n=1 Tax=Mycobacterium phage Finemlucis TaxID=2015844 RepID=A0A291I9Y1_9CAUD|nr:hypothetical protein J4T96_gp090 [Mycobacterium phage Finemlucis]ATG86501.1 hypothetical protein SEA_FINEMLUCIS_90 [Mycobacterium phage Finemlucis]